MLGTWTTEGLQRTRLGSVLNYNLALSASPGARPPAHEHPHAHGEHHDEPVAVAIVLEANGEWHARNRIDGGADSNSGGTLVYLAPRVRYGKPGHWSLSGSLGLPVVQELHGMQHRTSLRGLVSLGVAL